MTIRLASIMALLAGLLFGIGLTVSGMANPAKVLGFLDLAGQWDPSLAFVMAGAIAIGSLAFSAARRLVSVGAWRASVLALHSSRSGPATRRPSASSQRWQRAWPPST